MESELKLIVELFSKVTDGALIGGVSYLVLNFLQSLVPWVFGSYMFIRLLDRLPKVVRLTNKGE